MSRAPAAPRHVLVIQLRRLGDTVITTALLEDLRRAFPEARLDFLTRSALAPLLREHPLVAECIGYDRERPVGMWREVRSRRYDWIIDSESSPRSALLTRLSGSRVRVGWGVRAWQWLYTHRVSRRGYGPPAYVVGDRQRLLRAVGVPVLPTRPRLYLAPEERARGDDELAALGAPPGRPRVGLVLSAGDRAKEWPVVRFAEVAEALAAEGATPVVFHMPGDRAKVARFSAATDTAVLAPGDDLRRFMRLLAGCRAFIAADTGPVHVATALDIPTVTVFGPQDPAGWSAGIDITATVRGDTARCPECRRRLTGVEHTCVASVGAGTVLARAREYVQRIPGAATP